MKTAIWLLAVVLFSSTQLLAKVSQGIKAINYQVQSGSTTVDFVGTELMPKAQGEAKVEAKKGYIEIEVEFKDLGSPTQFGTEYLTYVLWAVSPEGRTVNLGELVVKDGGAKLNVTSDLQVFAMGVTAEPYFAVRSPSSVVVMKNEPRKSTQGKVFVIDAKVDLLERGHYQKLGNPLGMSPDKKTPSDMYQARNAILVAEMGGASQYAGDIFKKAQASLQMAEKSLAEKAPVKTVSTQARQAVQFSEDARALAAKRQEEERIAQEKADAAAKAKAQAEAKAAAEALEAKQKADAEAQRQAELAAAREAQMKAEAEAARLKAQAEQDALRAKEEMAKEAAARARQDAEKAEREKQALRASLLEQFNRILSTRDTPRGLVVTMADVLFDTGKYNLRPEARERLARLSGIVLAHPGLNLEVEGHTDSTGGDELNQKLSEQRAGTTREYLIQQGLSDGSITAKGYGKTMPVADNSTAQGRQQNRRVELIVSGEVIGAQIGAAKATP
ncbi:MAG TPA: OmpA family protein [Terriglobia bacterium]|nr:OmpA family protein [Terriglobia bacterium]